MGFFDGLGSLIGGLLGIGSNAASNATNMKINKNNLQAAYQMFNEQMDYNYAIYQDQKEYNSAAAQRQRLEEAGINPYTALGDAGSAGSSSAPSFSVPQQIPSQPIVQNTGFIQEAIDKSIANDLTRSQIDKTNAEASQAWTDANFKRTFNDLTVARGIADLKNVDEETKSKILDNYVKQNTADYSIQSSKADVDFKFVQMRNVMMDIATKQAGLPYISQKAQLEIDNLASDLLSKKSARKLTQAQIEDTYASVLLKNKQRLNMPNLSTEQANLLAKYMVQSAQGAAQQAGFKGSQAGLEYYDYKSRTAIPDFIKRVGAGIDAVNPLKLFNVK